MSDAPTIRTQEDYDEYIESLARDEIENTIENLATGGRWSGDLDELREEVYEMFVYSIECYDELSYNYPAFWGMVAHFSHASDDQVSSFLYEVSDPRSTLRTLALACVVADIRPEIDRQLEMRRDFPEVFRLFDRYQVSPGEFEIDGYRFVNRADGELTAFNPEGVRVESYTPEAYRHNHLFPEAAFLENVAELIEYDPDDLSDWLDRNE